MAHAFAVSPDRTLRLRARRLSVDIAALGPVRARLHHASLGAVDAEVRDLSLNGLAIALEGATEPLVFGGDRVEELEVTVGERLLFKGTGVVRRITEDESRIVVGIELEGGGIDLAEYHRLGMRRGFAQRLHKFAEETGRKVAVRETFKAFVADLRSDLEDLREFLQAEEESYSSEDLATRIETERQVLDELSPWIVQRMFGIRDEVASLTAGLSDDEHAAHRAYFKGEVMHLFSESPFMRRASSKPLGYAGDYEMMNMLYRDHREGPTLFAKALNVYATSEGAAVANVNRIAFLGKLIESRIAASSRERVRIASIGCGPAKEISALLERSPELGARLEVALIDQEERSIAHCERELAPLARSTGLRVQFIRESLRRLLTTSSLGDALGQRELIYSAGLFDYLSERTSQVLLAALYGALSDGGLVAIGNVAEGNPSRPAMEYFLEWFLIHRTPEDLQALTRKLSPAPSRMEVTSEPTGVNLFLFVYR